MFKKKYQIMKGKRCKHQISGWLSKVLEVSQGLYSAVEWGGGGEAEGYKHARRGCIPWEKELGLLPPQPCPLPSQKETRVEASRTLGQLLGGTQSLPDIAKLPAGYPFVPRASTELWHSLGAAESLALLSQGEKKEKDIIAAINH